MGEGVGFRGEEMPGGSVADKVGRVVLVAKKEGWMLVGPSRVAGEWAARGRRVQVCTRTK